jgi:hypothetical protein
MNKTLQDYARNELKNGLAMLPDSQQLFFKRMYSHKNLDANVNDVVDAMPAERLDWAMQQVQRGLDEQEVGE